MKIKITLNQPTPQTISLAQAKSQEGVYQRLDNETFYKYLVVWKDALKNKSMYVVYNDGQTSPMSEGDQSSEGDSFLKLENAKVELELE